MRIGFKVGPKNWEEGKLIVQEDGARLCEMWFRIDQAEEYKDMFTWLKQQHVDIGLHHWGLIDGVYKTNLASANSAIRNQTIQQVKDTIDVAVRLESPYVNAHCGAQATEKISFNPHTQELVEGSHIEKIEAEKIFTESYGELQAYAKKQNVLLTIETLPRKELYDHDRSHTYDPGNISHTFLAAMLSNVGGSLANDITHTAAQLSTQTSSRELLWENLHAFTKETASFTRLVHVNTVTPPFNGTDSHNGLLEEDFSQGAFPTQEQVKTLLELFRTEDIFVIPEPRINMRENYQALVSLTS